MSSSKLDFSKAEFITSYGTIEQLPASERPEFVFSGRSNVGKSSLINKLCNRKKLAKVSSTPGKTATINFYGAGEVYLVDLPGYGYAKVSNTERERWNKLINAYFNSGRDIRLLLQLLDSRHDPSKDDINMLEYLAYYNIPFIAVLTKSDKLKPAQAQKNLEHFKNILEKYHCKDVILSSAENNLGIEDIRAYMENEALNSRLQ